MQLFVSIIYSLYLLMMYVLTESRLSHVKWSVIKLWILSYNRTEVRNLTNPIHYWKLYFSIILLLLLYYYG